MKTRIQIGFICEDCDCLFEQPRIIIDRDVGSVDAVCPDCSSDCILEAYRCQKCDAAIPDEQSAFLLCASCEEETRQAFTNFLASLSDEQLEYVDHITDGTAPSDILKGELSWDTQ